MEKTRKQHEEEINKFQGVGCGTGQSTYWKKMFELLLDIRESLEAQSRRKVKLK